MIFLLCLQRYLCSNCFQQTQVRLRFRILSIRAEVTDSLTIFLTRKRNKPTKQKQPYYASSLRYIELQFRRQSCHSMIPRGITVTVLLHKIPETNKREHNGAPIRSNEHGHVVTNKDSLIKIQPQYLPTVLDEVRVWTNNDQNSRTT